MTYRHRFAKLLMLLIALCGIDAYAQDSSFITLCYHDVRPANSPAATSDTMTIRTTEFVAQLDWLRAHGYQAVSLSDIIDAKMGKRALPPKAVLLTFDDGYQGFYHEVFPLLQLYQMPAVLGLVTAWMEKGSDDSIGYTATPLPRKALLTWDQVRAITKTGLVEVVSHSHDLHHGIVGNPQGNVQPAAETRRYDAQANSYESDEAYRARIEHDLAQSAHIIEREVGVKPRALIWPFGSFTAESLSIAHNLGMVVTMGLTEGRSRASDISALKRLLIGNNATLSNLVADINQLDTRDPRRAVFVRLDDIYSDDNATQEKKIGDLIERVIRLGVNTVVMLPLSDPLYTGAYTAAYFPNDQLPMRADLLNRVTWQVRTRTRAKAFAWAPLYGLTPRVEQNTSANNVDIGRLYAAMARQAHIFGAVLDLGPIANDTAPPTGAELDALYKTMKTYRPELVTAVMTDVGVTDQLLETALPPGVRDTYAVADIAMISAPSKWQNDDTLDKLAARLATLPHGRSHSIVVLPPRKGSAAATDAIDFTEHAVHELLARGVRGLAFADDIYLRDDKALAAVRRSLSLANVSE